MIKNNVKTLIYFGLWYFVLVSSVLFTNFRGFIARFIPDNFNAILFYGIATIIFSLLFAFLFLRPQGTMMDNFTSIGSLVALNIGVILVVALGVLFTRYSYIDLITTIVSIFVQLVMILGILKIKSKKE